MLETVRSHRVSWSYWFARNEITVQDFTVLESCSISTTDTWTHPSPCSLPKLQLRHKVRRWRPKWFLPPAGCSHSCLREPQWVRFWLLNIADIFQCRHKLNTPLQFQLHDLSSVLFGHSQHPSIRLDSFRRDPWSTMITPSLSPIPWGSCLNSPFPVAKHMVDEHLLLEGYFPTFTSLGTTHLGLLPVSPITDLWLRKELLPLNWCGRDNDSNDIFARARNLRQLSSWNSIPAVYSWDFTHGFLS